MSISEPMTAFTDLLIAILSLVFAFRLGRGANRAQRWWCAAFVATAVAAFTGGTYHAIRFQASPALLFSLWKATVWSIGVTSLALVAGSATALTSPRTARVLVALAGLQFLIYAAWMWTHDAFIFVIADYGLALVCVTAIHVARYRRAPRCSRLVFASIAVAVLAAAIQASGFSLHQHFNHNDLYHVVQMIALYLLYRAGTLLPDATASDPEKESAPVPVW